MLLKLQTREFDNQMRELQDLEEKHPEHRDENSPTYACRK